MNGKMWTHPATVENVSRLKKRGAKFIGPARGQLACGYEGLGRLWDVDGIVESVVKNFSGEESVRGKSAKKNQANL
jgi:phosphopantothenoylcysteine synthetase/decarboxylase